MSYFIPEPRIFFGLNILSDDIKKPRKKETQKDIKNLINNRNFLVQEPDKGGPTTPCMGVYRKKSVPMGV